MEMAPQSFLAGLPQAMTIWLTLVLLGVVVAGGSAALARAVRMDRVFRAEPAPAGRGTRVHRRHAPPGGAEPGVSTRPGVRAGDPHAAHRQAAKLAAAADRAATVARHWHDEWTTAQRSVEAAWRAYNAAYDAARQTQKALAYPLPGEPATAEEATVWERHLHRTAYEAHRRGQLSVDQLLDVLAHRNGFDPRCHPFVQEAMMRRAARDRLLGVYKMAVAIERETWREAEAAAQTRRALRAEARLAAERAAVRAHDDAPTLVLGGQPRRVDASAVPVASERLVVIPRQRPPHRATLPRLAATMRPSAA